MSLQSEKKLLKGLLVGCAFLAAGSSSNLFATQDATHTLPLDDLQRFTSVVEQIRKYYVKPVNDSDLF